MEASGLTFRDVDKVLACRRIEHGCHGLANAHRCGGQVPDHSINPDEAVAKGAPSWRLASHRVRWRRATVNSPHPIGSATS